MDQDQKDVLISQLKAENFELKQKERDYGILNSQLLDLEHRFKLLQEEKARGERDAREREELMLKKADLLQLEVRKQSDTAGDKQRQIKDTEVELNAYKDLVAEKNGDISNLREELARYREDNEILSKEKRNAEADLDVLREGRKAAQGEVERLRAQNDSLLRSHASTGEKEKETALEVSRLRRKMDDLTLQLDDMQKGKAQKENEVDIAREGRLMKQREVERLVDVNRQFKEDKIS